MLTMGSIINEEKIKTTKIEFGSFPNDDDDDDGTSGTYSK